MIVISKAEMFRVLALGGVPGSVTKLLEDSYCEQHVLMRLLASLEMLMGVTMLFLNPVMNIMKNTICSI